MPLQFSKKCRVDLSPGTSVAPRVGQHSFLHIRKSSLQTESENCYKLLHKTFARFHLSLLWNCLSYAQETCQLKITPQGSVLDVWPGSKQTSDYYLSNMR